MRAVATATAASRGVANDPKLTWDCLAASQTLACHGRFLRCSGYTSLYPLLDLGLRTSSCVVDANERSRVDVAALAGGGDGLSFEREASISTRRTLRKRGGGFYETFDTVF